MMPVVFPFPTALLAPITPDAAGSGSVSGLLVYIAVALGFSFLCSLCEAVLLTSSLSHIEVQAQAGDRAGLLMRRLKENVERPISAILTLNTIAHTVGAAGAGAEAAAIFGNEFIGLISAVLTLLILVLSEIIPKTLGAVYWKPLLPFAAYTIQLLVWVLYPAVWAFDRLTRLLTPDEKEPTVTRSEIEVLARISTGEGGLAESEHLVLRNLLHLGRVHVSDIMTPRTVMLALQQDMTVGEVMQRHRLLPFSRIPVFDQSPDDSNTFVLRSDILSAAAEDRDSVPLREMARPLHSIPETMAVDRVVSEFIARHQHIFLVFDEFGGTAGIITLEDAIESLLGVEITDESDLVEDLRQLAQQRYQRQARLLGLSLDEPPPQPQPPEQGLDPSI